MSIYTKLLEIQAMHLAFEKDASNPFFKAKYVSLDSIVEKLTPILDSKKLLVFHYTDNKEIVTTLLDTESTDETQETRCIDSKFPLIDSNDPQKLGSCITYAKRYNLGQIFNIITDRDDDGNEASGKEVHLEDKRPWAPIKPATKQSYSWSTVTNWFNKPQLEECIEADNAYSLESISAWANDNGYKLSNPSRAMIEKYLTKWEL